MSSPRISALKSILKKIKWKEAIALLMLLMAFVFFHNERDEISALIPQIKHSDPFWMAAGVCSALLYIFLQTLMYIYCFRSAGITIGIAEAADVFLKRNFLSVFLPAGGVTSLAYMPKSIKRRELPVGAVHHASAVYGYVGILSVFIAGVPLLLYAAAVNPIFKNNLWLLAAIGIAMLAIYSIYRSFKTDGKIMKFFRQKFPAAVQSVEEILTAGIVKKYFCYTVAVSVLIEFCGILQVLLAMYALGTEATVSAAAVAYIISVILMIVSPFLRGLGAVEFSMAFILAGFGYRHSQGLGITLLYRFFEFWLPLAAGLVSFFWNGRRLVARLVPAMFIFALGIINILSVITPPIASRFAQIKIYFPLAVLQYSKMFTLISGILLLFTAAYMLKAYRRAWMVAVMLSVFSIAGNIVKALDYEEALFAAVVLLLLLYTRKEYQLKTRKLSVVRGFSLFLSVFLAAVILDFLTFYFISPEHFGIDFSWKQSFYYTLHTFLFFRYSGLQPYTAFARDFIYLNQFLGMASWVLLIFFFYKAAGLGESEDSADFGTAEHITHKYGVSALDYFKLTDEKRLYFASDYEGFVSYRGDSNFAVVLEEPVCAHEYKPLLIAEFEQFCHSKGLRVCYYRVGEDGLKYLKKINKKHLLIGQEGIVHLSTFKLEGKERKSLRNAANSLYKKGYRTEILYPPHTAEVMAQLANVSDEWLAEFDKKEIVFAEGKFDKTVLAQQKLVVLKDNQSAIVAFLNIIPDFAPGECTYDLIRRSAAAPGGAMDVLLLKLIEYAKSEAYETLNIGMAPLAGLDKPDNYAEEIMRFAYHRIGSFRQYQSLRFFKEKYADSWQNKYLVYGSDADLLQLTVSLSSIMKP